MNALLIALICAALAVASTLILKFVSKEVPIVLIGLPVILAGLATIGAVALLSAVGAPAVLLGVAGLASAVCGGYSGYKLANSFFTDDIMR